MNQLQQGFDVTQHVRCGSLIDRVDLAAESPAAARSSPSALFLHMRVGEAELSRFESMLVPISTRLTVFPSPAGVMYAVVSLQSGAQQWRHVIPLWNQRARQWLEDMIAQQRVSLACHVTETNQVAVMQLLMDWPQSEQLLRLAEDWPELADQDKIVDLGVMIQELTRADAIPSAHSAYKVAEVRIVTHCSWLTEYLMRASMELITAHDIATYSQVVH